MSSSLGEKLLPEYSTRLDSALVLAICSEYSNDEEAAARSTLDALFADAVAASHESNGHHAQSANADATHEDALSSSGMTSASATTDEELVERAFRDWTLATETDDSPEDLEKPATLPSFDYDANASDPITFLKNLFPKRERVELDLAFQDSRQDIETTIETLLTEDLLIREEEQDYARWLSGAYEDEDAHGKRKNRQRHRKLGKQTVSLTSTPRGISSQTSSRAGSPERHAKEPTNVWAQTDSTVLYLATLLSIPPGQLSSLFYSNNNSLPLALSKILDKAEHEWESIDNGPRILTEMRTLFPDKPITTLRRCLCAVGGNSTKAVELVQTLEEIYTREGTPLAHDLLLGSTLQTNGPKLNSALVKEKPASAAFPPIANGAAASARPTVPFERPPAASECLSLAWTLKSKRDDAYRSAARSWQAKNALGNSGVAAYWAEHGRHLDRQAREWELRAARATVDERRTQARSLQSVDLHGLTVAQALTVTSECLTAWWSSPSSPMSLTIVTGAGKHSSGQNPVILPAVRKLLEREQYDYRFDGERYARGSLTVIGLQGRRKASGY